MNEIIAQTKLLCTHEIVSAEQLFSYQEGVHKEITTLMDARRAEYNRLRWCAPQQAEDHKQRIRALSRQLSALRKEVKLCAGILSRANAMQNTLAQVKQEAIQQRKEEAAIEQQRSGRSGRQHELKRN